jgi:hypothetical protein
MGVWDVLRPLVFKIAMMRMADRGNNQQIKRCNRPRTLGYSEEGTKNLLESISG